MTRLPRIFEDCDLRPGSRHRQHRSLCDVQAADEESREVDGELFSTQSAPVGATSAKLREAGGAIRCGSTSCPPTPSSVVHITLVIGQGIGTLMRIFQRPKFKRWTKYTHLMCQ